MIVILPIGFIAQLEFRCILMLFTKKYHLSSILHILYQSPFINSNYRGFTYYRILCIYYIYTMYDMNSYKPNDSSRPIIWPSSTGKCRAYNYSTAEIIIIILRFNEHLIMLIHPVVCCGRSGKEKISTTFAACRDVYIIRFILKDARSRP